MIDAGDYRARAVKGALGMSGNGNEQVGVEFDLLDHPGQKITWYGTFTEAAFEIAMRGLRAAGFRGDDLSDLSSLNDGQAPEVLLVVEHETYKGKTRPRVKFINSVGGLAMKDALQPDQAKAFAERMKAKVLLFNQAQPPPKTQPRSSDNGPPLDHLETQDPSQQSDEIPF